VAIAEQITVYICPTVHSKVLTMIEANVFLALATLGAVNPAAASEQQNQLETARVPQPMQRLEIGVDRDNSAFKFRFADPVWLFSPA
jgi:hypothetical protein